MEGNSADTVIVGACLRVSDSSIREDYLRAQETTLLVLLGKWKQRRSKIHVRTATTGLPFVIW
jgi:hypothetical protein